MVSGEVSVENNVNSNARDNSRIHIKQRQVLRILNKPKPEGYAYKQDATQNADLNDIQVLQIDSAKLNRYDGWKQDLLVFDGNTLAEITNILERRYDVKINMKDAELQNLRYYGSFKNIDSIQNVLEIIKANTPINYTIDNNTINIKKTNINNKK